MCDIWSCGVIMYVILCGYPPFAAEEDREILDKVKKGRFDYPSEEWSHVSQDAKDLINHMLIMKTHDRFTAEQAMNDAWIKEQAPNATNAQLNTKMVDNLKSFRVQNKFKKAGMQMISVCFCFI